MRKNDMIEEKFVITEITRVIMVGKDEYPSDKNSFSHELDNNELIFHFSGHTHVLFDDQVLETTPNSIRFLPQGRVKRYDVVRHERGECIDVFFKADRPIAECAFVIDAKHNEKLGMLFKRLFATWVAKNDGYYFESISLLYKIFAKIQCDNYVSKQHYVKIKPAIDAIHERFLHEELSLSCLAAECGVGVSYFQRLFREKYGMPPGKYIIQLKINYACELLRLGRYSVTQVAEQCNFSDVYFFSRQFKEYMGVTPTQFCKKYRSSK